jgi:hypothetical protein
MTMETTSGNPSCWKNQRVLSVSNLVWVIAGTITLQQSVPVVHGLLLPTTSTAARSACSRREWITSSLIKCPAATCTCAFWTLFYRNDVVFAYDTTSVEASASSN